MRILYLFGNTVLEREIASGLRSLGHDVLQINCSGRERAIALADFLSPVDAFQPQLVFTVNYQGFDANGTIARAFEQRGIPVCSWELDHPWFADVATGRKRRESPQLTQFLWDEGYVGELRTRGYSRVFYMPLGVDLACFSGAISSQTRDIPVLFVGTSLAEFFAQYSHYLPMHLQGEAWFLGLCARVYAEHAENTALPVVDILRELAGKDVYVGLSQQEADLFELFVEMLLGAHHRKECLRLLSSFPLHVYGDVGWRGVVPAKQYRGKIGYGMPLAALYHRSQLVLNVTLPKNRWDSNQRAFDASACGALVVGDARKNNAGYFSEGSLPTVANIAALPDLVSDWLAKPVEVSDLAQRLQSEAHARHGLTARLEEMLKTTVG